MYLKYTVHNVLYCLVLCNLVDMKSNNNTKNYENILRYRKITITNEYFLILPCATFQN